MSETDNFRPVQIYYERRQKFPSPTVVEQIVTDIFCRTQFTEECSPHHRSLLLDFWATSQAVGVSTPRIPFTCFRMRIGWSCAISSSITNTPHDNNGLLQRRRPPISRLSPAPSCIHRRCSHHLLQSVRPAQSVSQLLSPSSKISTEQRLCPHVTKYLSTTQWLGPPPSISQ